MQRNDLAQSPGEALKVTIIYKICLDPITIGRGLHILSTLSHLMHVAYQCKSETCIPTFEVIRDGLSPSVGDLKL